MSSGSGERESKDNAVDQSAIEEVDANLVFQPPAPETPFIDINREIEKLVRD